MTAAERWTIEQVAAVAPTPSAVGAAEPLADPSRWAGIGCDDRAAWGRCRGSGAEPYDTMVDHADVAWRCSCPSRRHPCKHALALLLMWARGQIVGGPAPEAVARWISGRDRRQPDPLRTPAGEGNAAAPEAPDRPLGEPPPDPANRDKARDDRVARMMEGLVELDRWLDDRIRTGLADPSLARYATWDSLAARLVDARAGSLANRVRRLAGLVGASPDWHAQVLAELGVLHLLAQAGRRVPDLPPPLADAVATATGWQVRQADVLAGVPDTDHWIIAGRSDTREDRIEVRRTWLWGTATQRWAMVLSFAAYRQSLDTSLPVGTTVHADLHRYPGPALRAIVGRRHAAGLDTPSTTLPATTPPAVTIAAALDQIGAAVAREPWLERHPATVRAAPTVVDGRWVVTDATGSLALIAGPHALASLLAASLGKPVELTVEWTPIGVLPLTVHLDDRVLDIGPRADPSFVSAA